MLFGFTLSIVCAAFVYDAAGGSLLVGAFIGLVVWCILTFFERS